MSSLKGRSLDEVIGGGGRGIMEQRKVERKKRHRERRRGNERSKHREEGGK